jgi:AcrR family transcriptional regulator
MPSQSERNQATRSALLDAGRMLFAKRGYEKVAVGEIAKLAGVTTGALYHQFGSKEGLFKAVYGELVQRVWANVLTARGNADGPSLMGDCEAYLDACADPAFSRITVDGPTVLGWDQILDETQAMIQASLLAARDRGEIADAADHSLARMLAAALKEAAIMIAAAEDPADARRAAGESARRLLSGVLAHPR